jgi:hypothetical protein
LLRKGALPAGASTQMGGISMRTYIILLALVAVTVFATRSAEGGGKAQLYATRMEPYGQDAERFSRHSWGGGLNAVVPAPFLNRLLAGVVGFDHVNMMYQKTASRDATTGLRLEQQTSQGCTRPYLGCEIGPHGRGFIRPHAGINLATSIYSIGTDVVIPDDSNREDEIRQNLRHRTETALGYDISLGCDFNVANKVVLDVGARFQKTFNVPQQLGAGSVQISPSYLTYYLGVGTSFETFKSAPSGK